MQTHAGGTTNNVTQQGRGENPEAKKGANLITWQSESPRGSYFTCTQRLVLLLQSAHAAILIELLE